VSRPSAGVAAAWPRVAQQELAVLVDRPGPARFAILWPEVRKTSARDREMRRAQAGADRLNLEP